MKHIALDRFYLKPKLLMTMLLMLTLSMFAIHSKAAQTEAADTGDKTSAQRFDHTATGYPLTGAHVTIADCGSCHVGGVFKGTTHNCNGCHSRGQRVVALAMSSGHLVTTEPCDICHTNTVTFLGARFNHGRAIPGQCGTCHNGSIAPGRPASHTTNVTQATYSCDKCHRPTVWLPSYWNHVGAIPQCGGCHATGQLGSLWVKTNIGGTSAEGFAHGSLNNSIDCVSCHHNYTNWLGAAYDHASAGGSCLTCHDGSRATGKAQFASHLATTVDCGSCHHGYASWLGASFDHTGIGSATCSSCHNGISATGRNQVSGTSPEAFAHNSQNNSIDCVACHSGYANWLGAIYNHAGASAQCSSCHGSGRATPATPVTGTSSEAFAHNPLNITSGGIDCSSCHSGYTNWLGALYSHSGAGYTGTCSTCHAGTRATGLTQAVALYPTHVTSGECNSCHSGTTTWLGATGNMPSNHIPFTAGPACNACHTGASTTVTGAALHGYLSSTCKTCHDSNNTAYAWTNNQPQRVKLSSHHSAGTKDCLGCHTSSYTRWGGAG